MWLTKFRLKYFIAHLSISLLLACCCLFIVFYIWYPAPLAKAVGVTSLFFIMLVVDVILGPTLTLIVAEQGKKFLKFDLVIIFLIQLFALTYGLYSISSGRPVWIVFDTLRFEVAQANNIPIENLKQAKAPYNILSWGKPQFVAVIPTKNEKEKSNRTFVELQTGVAPSMQPTLYEPIFNQSKQIKKQLSPLSELVSYNEKNLVKKTLIKYPNANAFLPLKANEVDMVVLLNKESGQIIKIVDLRPWK